MTYLKRERDTSGITARGVVVALGVPVVKNTIVTEADPTNEITTEAGVSLAME